MVNTIRGGILINWLKYYNKLNITTVTTNQSTMDINNRLSHPEILLPSCLAQCKACKKKEQPRNNQGREKDNKMKDSVNDM